MIILEPNIHLVQLMRDLVEVAKKAKCSRSKCGSIITDKDFYILGEGYNSMPCNIQDVCFKDNLAPTFKSDKTCCIHAEQRAIIDALNNRKDLAGAHLYFIRLDENDNPKYSGEPYCSICSKMALDVGIEYFHLWRKDGWNRYYAKEYNDITFQYK